MRIWVPKEWVKTLEKQEEEVEHQRLKALFEEHLDWQVEADKLHQTFMDGKACDRCMRIIERRHLALDAKPDS